MIKYIFFIGLIFCFGCNKEDVEENANTQISIPRYFEYDILFLSSGDSAFIKNDNLSDTSYFKAGSSLFLKFNDLDGINKLLFYIDPFQELGDYNEIYVQHNNTSTVNPEGGMLNISEINLYENYLKGTFSAVCCISGQNFIIKNGSFVIDYWE